MIPFEELVLHAHGELEGADADAVDEHVLACASCAHTFEWLLRLPESVADVVRAGALATSVTEGLVAELREAGLISRSYELEPERPVPCSVSRRDIYALTTLKADLGEVTRLDVVVAPSGLPLVRMVDVPFDRATGRASYVTPSRLLLPLPSARVTIELYAVEGEAERRIGRYFLEHTAWAGD